MNRGSIPDRFGPDYRAAVFAVRPRSTPGVVLAWVLLDEVFRTRSTTVVLGQRLLRDLTHLHGRSLDRGRDWLVEHELLIVNSVVRGQSGRTEWTLRMPARARSFPGSMNDRTNDRTNDRVGADTVPGPLPSLASLAPRAHGRAGAREAAPAQTNERPNIKNPNPKERGS